MGRFLRNNLCFRQQKVLKQEGELLSRIGELLDEGYTFHDALLILLPHHTVQVTEARQIAVDIFKEGKGPADVLEALGIEKRRLLPIELASLHGRLPSAISAVADQIVIEEKLKERLMKLVTYPIVLFVFMGILFVLFRVLFLPNMQQLGKNRIQESDDGFAKLPELLLKIPDMFVLMVITITVVIFVFVTKIKKEDATEKLKVIYKIPLLRYWYRMVLTASFSREVGNMLQAGMSLQDSLDALRKQDSHSLIRVIAERVRGKVVEGEPLSSAVKMDKFVPNFSSFVEHGEYGGHLAKEMIIFSQLLDAKMEKECLRALAFLQPLLFSILAICILSAYLAILLPMYELLNTI